MATNTDQLIVPNDRIVQPNHLATQAMMRWMQRVTKPPAGAWTPVWQGTVGDPVVTYVQQSGFYQVWSRMVSVSGVIEISAVAGGAGNLRIGGLPYVPGAAEAQRGGFKVNFMSGFAAGTTPETLVPVASATQADLFRRTAADARNPLTVFSTVAELLSPSLMFFSGFYFI